MSSNTLSSATSTGPATTGAEVLVRAMARLRVPVLALASALSLMAGCTAGSGSVAGDRTAGLQALENELVALDAAVERAADVSAIKRLQRAYGYYFDQKRWDDMADLFAQDGTIEIGLDGVYVGQKRVREYLHALGGGTSGLKPGELNDHLIVQPAITVSEDGRTAKGRWRAVIMGGELGKDARWGEGVYENEYVRENGVWKIASLHWYQTFIVPYEGGWAKHPDLTNGILVSKQLPPDRPPSQQYGVWPDVFTPPFHYPASESVPALPPKAARSADASPAEAALQAAVDQLRERLQRVHDIDAIEKLVSKYGYYLDKQQWDLFTELFAEQSQMEISQRGVYFGRKGVRRAVELFGPQHIEKNHVHNHIQLQPVIHVSADGQTARVRSRALSMLGTFGAVGVWGDGVYENEFVKENGVWRFKVDHVYTTFFAPYEPGWGTGSRPTPKASPKIPPDAPPTEIYESFPEVYLPKYHYANPVANASASPPAAIDTAKLPARARALVSKIESTLARLEAEDAIENLQRIYGFYVDKAQWADAANLFTEDGTLELGGSGVYVGRERIRQFLARTSPEGLVRGRLMNDLQLQPIVDVAPDGRSATARWRYLGEHGVAGQSATWTGGAYDVEYVKDGGVWKIRRLHGFQRFATPYEQGWGKAALPLGSPDATFAPDRPPTVSYRSYPDPFVPPLRFKHPASGR